MGVSVCLALRAAWKSTGDLSGRRIALSDHIGVSCLTGEPTGLDAEESGRRVCARATRAGFPATILGC